MTDDSELLTKLSRYRDSQFAQWVTIAVALAAQTCPDELRKALASVFDLKGVEKDYDEIMRRTLLARQDLDQLRTESQLLKDELAELRKTVARSQEFLSNGKHSGPRVRP
jgi:hypothetical protein